MQGYQEEEEPEEEEEDDFKPTADLRQWIDPTEARSTDPNFCQSWC